MDNALLAHSPVAPYFSKNPEVVGIEITGRCPLRCRHCFNHSGPNNPNELPLNNIISVLDEMQEWGVKTLRLSGGEPTYHREFKQIVAECDRRGISIAMNTNGVYSQSLLTYLVSSTIELFIISIDGLEQTNDAIRGKGTFQKALDALIRLHQSGKSVLLSFHVGGPNWTDVGPLIDCAAALGVNFKVAPIRHIGRAKTELVDAQIKPEEFLKVVRIVQKKRRQYPQIKILTDFDVLDVPQNLTGDCAQDKDRRSCKAGRTMVNIHYDGNIYPCAFFVGDPDIFSAGNIKKTSVSQAWRSAPEFLPFRIQQKSPTCQSCSAYTGPCWGGCPAIAYSRSGQIDTHDPTCFSHLLKDKVSNG